MRNVYVATLICMLFGYLIGTLNPAFLIAKLKGFDIRERGSGNAGATNALITMGKHVENLKRIRTGKEARISYLWSKDEEVQEMAREARGK